MKILLVLTAAACIAAVPAVAQYNTPTTPAQNQNQKQNPNATVRSHENAQEQASGISDAVDIVSGPFVDHLTPTSAQLAWTTSHVAASRVRYGTDQSNPQQHAYEAGGNTNHRVDLNNLRPNTTYYYEIETRTGKDRFKGTFRTPQG